VDILCDLVVECADISYRIQSQLSKLAQPVTFLTYIREVIASNLGLVIN
jgi:hypothetical protein